MIVLFALVVMAMVAGLFYGLGSQPKRRRLAAPLARPELRAPSDPLAVPLPDPASLPGGDPSVAIPVPSPAVIEHHAERWPCPVCESPVRARRHRAETLAGRRLRVAEVHCPRCGFRRDIYFELAPR
jgi:hypothetical protein